MFQSTPMLETDHTRCFQGLEKLKTKYSSFAQSSTMFCLIDIHSKSSTIDFVTTIGYVKKHKSSEKPAQPAEVIFLTPELLLGAQRATPPEPASY